MTDAASLRLFLDIKNDDWDAVIVCDGSATSWDHELGFGSVVLLKGHVERLTHYGGTPAAPTTWLR